MMRVLRFLPFLKRRPASGILPIDPVDEQLLARQRADRAQRNDRRRRS